MTSFLAESDGGLSFLALLQRSNRLLRLPPLCITSCFCFLSITINEDNDKNKTPKHIFSSQPFPYYQFLRNQGVTSESHICIMSYRHIFSMFFWLVFHVTPQIHHFYRLLSATIFIHVHFTSYQDHCSSLQVPLDASYCSFCLSEI